MNDLTATPSVFLKEISSDGNVNTVDLIFQTWPVFISLNPNWIRMFFQPILSYLQSGAWPHPWVIHDIGTGMSRFLIPELPHMLTRPAYPNATGHSDGNAEQMPLFETSSLFILLYAYQKYTGDTAYASQYSTLLNGYAQYLSSNGLYPASQLISVDAIAASPNQTALAIQGAIGLNAASKLLNNNTYATTAASWVNTIYNQALGLDGSSISSSTHFTYNYGQSTTWNVVFTAFSDVVLKLNTFPTAAWTMQSQWYLKQIQVLGLPFAGPVTDLNYTGTGITWGLSDWSEYPTSVMLIDL